MRIRTERFKTLVILDEVHHAGDALSWGEGVREAFEPAARRLALTGTPFRSDVNPIPFVTYAPGDDGIPRSVADFTYGYAHALADHVVRPVLFMAYSGEMQWRTRAGDEIAARLGEPLTKDLTAQALRTALDPNGVVDPVGARGGRQPALGGTPPRARRGRPGHRDRPGLRPRLRQDAAADQRRAGDRRALRREGRVEEDHRVHRLRRPLDGRGPDGVRGRRRAPARGRGLRDHDLDPAVLRPGVGRFVRARTRGETASVFLPSVPSLLGFASEMEVERDHVLGRQITDEGDIFAAEHDLLAQANASEAASAELEMSFEALGSEAPLRPGAVRRRRVRPLRRGARRLRGGDGLPRHPGPARARPGARAAAARGSASARRKQKASAAPSRTRSPR